jgi:hypothetical protein
LHFTIIDDRRATGFALSRRAVPPSPGRNLFDVADNRHLGRAYLQSLRRRKRRIVSLGFPDLSKRSARSG